MKGGDTGRLMSETGIVPRKSRGQNFLIDDRVADRHIGYAEIRPGDRILEVGPGLGILTSRLTETGGNVTCIEIDDTLADHIESEYSGKVSLIRGDATKVPFPEFDVFVSNLPYSVSTPVIFKLLECRFRKAVVMVQKEFAERMTADVGSTEYSRLTVNLFYRADCRMLETVPASRFRPRPKVDSALVEIVPRDPPFQVLDEKTFFRVTEAVFNHRRKKISTALKVSGLIPKGSEVPYGDSRAEDLRPSELGEVADAVFRLRTL